MNNRYLLLVSLMFLALNVHAQEAEEAAEDDAAEPAAAEEAAAPQAPNQPRTMSGMSILGNEEAPKALVIIPWKSSELGDEIGMPEQLDDKATPVDRDVFLRELRFYEIRRGDE